MSSVAKPLKGLKMDDSQRIVKCGHLSLHSPGGFFKVSGPAPRAPLAQLPALD